MVSSAYIIYISLIVRLRILLFLSSPKDMLTDLQKEGKGGREKHRCERETSCPDAWGPNPPLGPGHSLGIETATFWFTGRCSNQLSRPGQGRLNVSICFFGPCLSALNCLVFFSFLFHLFWYWLFVWYICCKSFLLRWLSPNPFYIAFGHTGI